jgi:hypothetical protein
MGVHCAVPSQATMEAVLPMLEQASPLETWQRCTRLRSIRVSTVSATAFSGISEWLYKTLGPTLHGTTGGAFSVSRVR